MLTLPAAALIMQAQLNAVRGGKAQDEFKTMSSQVLCLKEAINFTET